MMQRQRILLYLIKSLQEKNRYSRTRVDKSLFLLLKEYGLGSRLKFYSFYPYKYGPFSELFYYDLRKLDSDGYLLNEKLTEKGLYEADKIDKNVKEDVNDICGRFTANKNLIEYVYSKYPDYTIKSKQVSTPPVDSVPGFFSIGYEEKDIDRFLDIIIHNDIQLVADVRYNPFSMQFSYVKSRLEKSLSKVNIGYVHMPELGIPSEYRKGLNDSTDYIKLFENYRKDILTDDKLEKLLKISHGKRVTLLCMERDPACCHRGIISAKLEHRGYGVTHL